MGAGRPIDPVCPNLKGVADGISDADDQRRTGSVVAGKAHNDHRGVCTAEGHKLQPLLVTPRTTPKPGGGNGVGTNGGISAVGAGASGLKSGFALGCPSHATVNPSTATHKNKNRRKEVLIGVNLGACSRGPIELDRRGAKVVLTTVGRPNGEVPFRFEVTSSSGISGAALSHVVGVDTLCQLGITAAAIAPPFHRAERQVRYRNRDWGRFATEGPEATRAPSRGSVRVGRASALRTYFSGLPGSPESDNPQAYGAAPP